MRIKKKLQQKFSFYFTVWLGSSLTSSQSNFLQLVSVGEKKLPVLQCYIYKGSPKEHTWDFAFPEREQYENHGSRRDMLKIFPICSVLLENTESHSFQTKQCTKKRLKHTFTAQRELEQKFSVTLMTLVSSNTD